MVKGLDRFKEHFADYADRYVLIGGTASSLSMEELVSERRTTMDGLSLVKADGLIPLKARAYVDLSKRKAAGEAVDSKNIRKHKNDMVRLFTVLDRDAGITLAASLQEDLAAAFALMEQDPPDLKSLGISRITFDEIMTDLRRIYGLPENQA